MTEGRFNVGCNTGRQDSHVTVIKVAWFLSEFPSKGASSAVQLTQPFSLLDEGANAPCLDIIARRWRLKTI